MTPAMARASACGAARSPRLSCRPSPPRRRWGGDRRAAPFPGRIRRAGGARRPARQRDDGQGARGFPRVGLAPAGTGIALVGTWVDAPAATSLSYAPRPDPALRTAPLAEALPQKPALGAAASRAPDESVHRARSGRMRGKRDQRGKRKRKERTRERPDKRRAHPHLRRPPRPLPLAVDPTCGAKFSRSARRWRSSASSRRPAPRCTTPAIAVSRASSRRWKRAAGPRIGRRRTARSSLSSRTALSITLEPAAQLELSGAPLLTIHETCTELRDHLRELAPISKELGITWLGLGFHPFASRADQLEPMESLKQRYGIEHARSTLRLRAARVTRST